MELNTDLTIEQRLFYSKMWDEANIKTAQGNGKWVVYGPMDNPTLRKW